MSEEIRQRIVEDGLVPVKEATRFLGISVAGLYSLMGRGELPYCKIGRSRRIPRRALVELAARALVGGVGGRIGAEN